MNKRSGHILLSHAELFGQIMSMLLGYYTIVYFLIVQRFAVRLVDAYIPYMANYSFYDSWYRKKQFETFSIKGFKNLVDT